MTTQCASFDLVDADDFSPLEGLLAGWGRVARLGFLVKTEGDYADDTRERARAAIGAILARHGLSEQALMVTVIGTEGISTPLVYVFAELDDAPVPGGPARLALGLASAAPPAEPLLDDAGTIDLVADVARAAMQDAGLTAEQVALLVINIPAPTSGEAPVRGRRARAVAAFGGGRALAQPSAMNVPASSLLAAPDIFVDRVQTFTGPGITKIEVIALGNRPGAGGDLFARAAIAQDLLDIRPFKAALLSAGLTLDTLGELAEPERVVACILKSGARADGSVRGARTTIRERGIPPEKHVRAVQTGQLGPLLGTTRLFNTFDPVHQAPDGGATACFIVR